MNSKLSLPCLKAKIGDWFYYIALMSFDEVSKRVKLPKEIDKKYLDPQLQLGEWIQRDLDKKRTKRIVEYLIKNDQRFFNSLILGIYEGAPVWQEIVINDDEQNSIEYDEETKIYLGKSFGVLTLFGDENIFAIDGQHRAIGIREAVKQSEKIVSDEVSVIFVAHKATIEGKIRTRRLFSTLNRYAKPVGKSDIIALSEDDNCAVITREVIDSFDLLKNKIIINKSPSISSENNSDFTNIRMLYDIIERILTNKKVYNFEVEGEDHYSFTNVRLSEETLKSATTKSKKILKDYLTTIPAFNDYLKTGVLNRKSKGDLIFRPIGQSIFFDVLKVAESQNKIAFAKEYFSENKFTLNRKVWRTIFWDEESNNIKTDKARIKYATLLILEHIGVSINKTKKDREMLESFAINPLNI